MLIDTGFGSPYISGTVRAVFILYGRKEADDLDQQYAREGRSQVPHRRRQGGRYGLLYVHPSETGGCLAHRQVIETISLGAKLIAAVRYKVISDSGATVQLEDKV